MSVAKWTSRTSVSLIASVGNLATGTGWATSGAGLIDNSVARHLYLDIELVLAAGVTAGANGPRVDVYLVPALNGVNVADPPGTSAGVTPTHYFVGAILANASASFVRGGLRGIVLPPTPFLITLNNNLGVSLGTGTHTLNGWYYGEEAV